MIESKEHLARLVRLMRQAQRRFFTYGQKCDLIEAKRMEIIVDRCISELLDTNQPTLFDERNVIK